MSRYRPAPEPWTRVAIPIVRAIASVASRPDYRGRSAFPRRGGLIVAANHLANVDPVLLARFVLELGRVPRFLAKHPLFETPVVGTVLSGARQIPVYRERANAADALSAAVEALDAGECVVIYPEGTWTADPDGWPMKARTGVARLALATGAPVVPVAHWGAQHVIGPGWRVRPRRLYSVQVGTPVDPAPWRGPRPPSGDTLAAVTDAVMGRVRDQLADLRGEPAPREVWDPEHDERRAAGFVRGDGAATVVHGRAADGAA